MASSAMLIVVIFLACFFPHGQPFLMLCPGHSSSSPLLAPLLAKSKSVKAASKAARAARPPRGPQKPIYRGEKTSVARIHEPPPWAISSTAAVDPTSATASTHSTLMHNGMGSVADIDLDNTAHQRLARWTPFPLKTPLDISIVSSHTGTDDIPSLDVPEIAFLGRSNVGKSSLLNSLSSSTAARVGKTPGATAAVNLYSVNSANSKKRVLGFTDLPGFGYAKLSKELKKDIEKAAEQYLSTSSCLALCILLVDSRRAVAKDDMSTLAALYDIGLPVCVVATKVDKFGTVGEVEKAREVVREGLGLPEGQPLMVSSVTGAGIRELWKVVMEASEQVVEDVRNPGNREEEEEGGEAWEDSDELVYEQGFDWVHAQFNEDYSDDDFMTTGAGTGAGQQAEFGEEESTDGPARQRDEKITLKLSLERLKQMGGTNSVP